MICLAGTFCGASAGVLPDNSSAFTGAANDTAKMRLAPSMESLSEWKFHPGDNHAYAEPACNDSQWSEVSLDAPETSHDPYFSSSSYVPGWTARGFPNLNGFAWYRTRVKLAAADSNLWIEMPPDVDDAYQVYANGQLIGSFGKFSFSHVRSFYSRAQEFRLPAPDTDGNIVLAVRFYMEPDTVLWNFGAGGLHAAPVIGLGPTVALLHERNNNGILDTLLSYLALGLVALIACIAALSIFWKEKSEQAYLWLTMALAMESALNIASLLAAETYLVSLTTFAILNEVLGSALVPLCWLLFWTYWFGLRTWRPMVRLAASVAALELLIVFSLHEPLLGTVVPLGWMHGLWRFFTILRFAFAFLLVAVTVGGIRRNRTEGWITVPAVALLGITLFSEDLEVLGVPISYFPFGIRLGVEDISLFVLVLMVLGLATRRFLQSKARQREMTNDLEQAKEVQLLLMPDHAPQVPGYRVEGTYLPASQVGGDFYQLLPLDGGGLIVLLGDVSGKGLRAAMVVSMVVGAARAIVKETTMPAEILTRLNRELTGNLKSGFVTCVCIRADSAGAVAVANAGHLAPWLNKDEIALAGTLPLGITAGAQYTSQDLQLQDGDTLTLLSDGVVEARHERDGTLFGFNRLQALFATSPSAEIIAHEAQQFGQEDDISVLSIRRLGTGSPPRNEFAIGSPAPITA